METSCWKIRITPGDLAHGHAKIRLVKRTVLARYPPRIVVINTDFANHAICARLLAICYSERAGLEQCSTSMTASKPSETIYIQICWDTLPTASPPQ